MILIVQVPGHYLIFSVKVLKVTVSVESVMKTVKLTTVEEKKYFDLAVNKEGEIRTKRKYDEKEAEKDGCHIFERV